MNIIFDLDGVLYPWHDAVYTYLRVEGGDSLPSFNVLWKDPYKYIKKEKWDFIATIPLLYSTILPKKEIVAMLKELDAMGHTLYYVTNREQDLERVTRKYLNDYNFPQEFNLIHTKDKDKIIRTLEIDVIVEDKVENLEKFSALCKTIGIEHPWNEEKRGYLESLGIIFIPSAEYVQEILC